MALPVYYYPLVSALIFTIGVYCLATKRSVIKMIIAIELMVNAANLNFVAFTLTPAGVDPLGQSFVLLSLGVGGAITAVALLLAIQIYRTYGVLDVEKLRRLRR